MSAERQQAIVVALSAELARQAKAGGGRLAEISGQLDLLALATAIDAALGGDTLEAAGAAADTKGPAGSGSSPKDGSDQWLATDQLDASNDE